VVLEDSGFSRIIALVLTYLWTKRSSAVLIDTDLPRIQKCHQWLKLDHLCVSHLGMLSVILGIDMKA
jgi:hypothetical protein